MEQNNTNSDSIKELNKTTKKNELKTEKGNLFNVKGNRRNVRAIVLSANPDMDNPVKNGLDKQVYNKAGRENLIKERKDVLKKLGIKKLKAGDIFVTSAGEMKEKHFADMIIHVIVPKYNENLIEKELDNNIVTLRSIIEKIFLKAKEYKIKTLFIPLIGTGALGFKKEVVKKLIHEAYDNVYSIESDESDFFADFEGIIVECDGNEKHIKDYLDINKLLEEIRFITKLPNIDEIDEIQLKNWVNDKEPILRELREIGQISQNLHIKEVKEYLYKHFADMMVKKHKNNNMSVDESELAKRLKYYMAREKITTDVELARRADINSSVVTRIKKGQTKNPDRDTLIKLAFALRLSAREAASFIKLGSSGLAFPKRNDAEEELYYECIKNKIYDMSEIKNYYKNAVAAEEKTNFEHDDYDR